jgi:hypothetical protein
MFDVIITKKEVDPSWQIPDLEDRKRKISKFK